MGCVREEDWRGFGVGREWLWCISTVFKIKGGMEVVPVVRAASNLCFLQIVRSGYLNSRNRRKECAEESSHIYCVEAFGS